MSKLDYEIGIVVAAAAACGWGMVYATSQRLVLPGRFTSLQLLTACFYVGSLLLLPFSLLHHSDLTKADHNLRQFLLFLVTLMCAEVLVFYSVYLLGGTEASLVQVSYPIWTAAYLYLTNGEIPSRLTVVGGCFIMAGVAYITMYGGNPDREPETLRLHEQRRDGIQQDRRLEQGTTSSRDYSTIGKSETVKV